MGGGGRGGRGRQQKTSQRGNIALFFAFSFSGKRVARYVHYLHTHMHTQSTQQPPKGCQVESMMPHYHQRNGGRSKCPGKDGHHSDAVFKASKPMQHEKVTNKEHNKVFSKRTKQGEETRGGVWGQMAFLCPSVGEWQTRSLS